MPSRFNEQTRKCGKSPRESIKQGHYPIGILYRFVMLCITHWDDATLLDIGLMRPRRKPPTAKIASDYN
jgi:hypothetical protein